MRPMSTVRAWRSPRPSASCPAARRSLTLFSIVAISSPPAACLPGPGGGLQLAHVLGPVASEELEALASGQHLARRALQARLVEIGRAARRAEEPRVRLAELGQQLVEALVLVQPPARLVHGVGVRGHRPWGTVERGRLDAPRSEERRVG